MDNNMVSVKSAKRFLSQCSSNVDDFFGDPLVLPRVGDQYQAEIPPLMMDCYHQKLTDTEVMTGCSNTFPIGLPIPGLCVQSEVENIETSEERQVARNNQEAEVISKRFHALLDNGEEVGLSTLNLTIRGDKMYVDLGTPEEKKTKLDRGDNAHCPLPSSPDEPWSRIEHDRFLLGLYIFGKNLQLVKRLVKTKEMGDILSYYYGKFYRSSEHRRWSEGRKMRSRRTITGQKLFTGWRQQELLSRLFSHVSEECRNILKEVSREFGGGKCSLEDYVFTLADTVGINVLVEAVGIGKGKQDLTRTAMDPVKTNKTLPSRPELPNGKSWSSLAPHEIVNFLKGDFRLSKARSNDLFWEAVWPRLLARGWNSEQPKDHNVCSSKNSLVFLIPGVKKFSRRRLVKGNHYFDCVTDVLSKVASDPGLLEVETEVVEAKEENLSDNLSKWQRYCYLQPPFSSCNGSDIVKLTIVDTTLIHVGDRFKVRELRTLPVDTRNISVHSDFSSGTDQDSSEESQDKVADEINVLNLDEDTTGSGTFIDSPEINILQVQDNDFPNHDDGDISKDTKLNEEESSSCLNSTGCQSSPRQTLLACSSSNVDQYVGDGNILATEKCGKKPQPQTLIDLNLPQVHEDPETNVPIVAEMRHNHDESGTVHQSLNSAANIEQGPALSARRQSTRNRPLTTKALEAIAYGLLSTNRKRKCVDPRTESDSISRSSRLVRGRAAASPTADDGIA